MDLAGKLPYVAAIWLIIINIIGFVQCAIDKKRARKNKWRIPEKSIFITALLGGSIGIFVSMLLYRHKTRHISFMAGIPLIFVVEAALLVYIIYAF